MPTSAERRTVDVCDMQRVSPSVPILVEEQAGLQRIGEPVTLGIPFPRGMVSEPASLVLMDQMRRQVPVQVGVLARWVDDSVKWALLDFQATVEAKGVSEYRLVNSGTRGGGGPLHAISVRQTSDSVEVDTGHARFFLNARTLKPFERVVIGGTEILEDGRSQVILTGEAGAAYEPRITDLVVETQGPLRVTLKAVGKFSSTQGTAFADFVSRISFYLDTSLVELKFTIRNPRAARHPGGLWDLGDKGSIYFKDLSIEIGLASEAPAEVEWTAKPGVPVESGPYSHFQIYQDSSGGPNWKSSNHVNRFGKVMNVFQGYRVTADGVVLREEKRATPVVSLFNGKGISATLESFWQNFPKAIGTSNNSLFVGLFPHEHSDLYELQGGEQKTHTIFFKFGTTKELPTALAWVHDKLVPLSTPEWYANSKAIPYLHPRSQQPQDATSLSLADTLVDGAIRGCNTFFDRREIIDEYGWRHFGDLYADHEAIGHKGKTPLVAHYNNQYDVIYGAVIQYLRNGDLKWFRLMDDLSKHVIDIDIYHTKKDRSAFNGGMFWHTEHYTDASTATHRAYSKASLALRSSHLCGGGPSSGHNYTTGLLHYYLLTGDASASEAVQGLADWVINLDDGSKNSFGFFDRRPTGLSTSTVSLDYHGPGRGSGNSINALIDAYVLTQGQQYLSKAEQLIRRCIHPKDDIRRHSLTDIEHRWSYTVFLQVLGKYLDMKVAEESLHYMYGYARASLLHYARWMLENEVPYKSVLDRVEIPTETWPAQDVRKSNVLSLAAKYADAPLRSACLRKSEFFFDACVTDLLSFKTCTLTRPIVILMTNAHIQAYFLAHPDETSPLSERDYDFGQPKPFTPQLYELQKARVNLLAFLDSVRNVVRRVTAKSGRSSKNQDNGHA